MGVFSYKARTQEGKAIEGEMDAASPEEAAKRLRNEGFLPTRIAPKAPAAASRLMTMGWHRVSTNDMILFNNQLANLISAGVPLLSSLRTIGKVMTNNELKAVIDQLGQRIAGGSSFSEALAEHKIFADLFVSMVRAGEAGGQLHLVLQRYAVFLEQQEEIRQKVMNALLYPCILLILGAVVVVYILSTVIPKFVDIFFKAGVPLPWPTQFLYGMGMLFRHHGYWLLAGLVVFIISFLVLRRLPAVAKVLAQWELSFPVMGPLKKKIYLSRFSRTLATLLESGVLLLPALDILQEVIGNSVLSESIGQARLRVEAGDPLSKPLEKSEYFPADIVQMITVGEESGGLSRMLSKTADFYDSYIDHAIKRLLILIEPALIVLMAGLVGIILASIILPLFDMIKTIR